jgi:site-specific DNA recombinase
MPKWIFDEVHNDRAKKRGSRDGNTLNKHPLAERRYVLRGRVHHSCGTRMIGDRKAKGAVYYLCWPGKIQPGQARPPPRAADVDPHPRGRTPRSHLPLLRGPAIRAGTAGAPERRPGRARRQRGSRTGSRAGTPPEGAGEHRLATGVDPAAGTRRGSGRPVHQGLRQSYNQLDGQKKVSPGAMTQLDEAEANQPASPTVADLRRLEALPYLAANLATAPRSLLYELFEATQLTVRVHGLGDQVTIAVRQPVDRLPETAQAAERITDAMSATQPKSSADLGQPSLDGSCLYPRWDSNPRYRRERPAS